MAAVDKTYGDALFSLVTEEDEKALPDILGQLKGVAYSYNPDRRKDGTCKRGL